MTAGGYDPQAATSRRYAEVDSQAPTPLEENHRSLFGAVMLGAKDTSERNTEPMSATYLSPGFMFPERPLSASGGTQNESYDEASLNVSHMEGLFRSQSAAPSLHTGSRIGPPPGLTLASSQSDSHANRFVGRRAASTGVLNDQQTALRPSAKTLMDLIQEDDDPVDSPQRTKQYEDRRPTSPSLVRQPNGQPNGHAGYDQLQYPQYREEMRAPAHARESIPVRTEDPYERSRQLGGVQGMQPQASVGPRYDLGMVQDMQPQAPTMPRYDHGQVQRGSQDGSPPSAYPQMQAQAPYAHTYAAQPPQQNHLYGGQHGQQISQPLMHSGQPPQHSHLHTGQHPQTSHLQPGQNPQASHQQQQQQQQQQPLLETRQHVYYGGQQQRVEMQQPTRLQAQVLPSGQTVYVNVPNAHTPTPPPPPQQPSYGYQTTPPPAPQQPSYGYQTTSPPASQQPSFGYQTLQYHPQQSQVIQPPLPRTSSREEQQQQQYVSVVPMQGGGSSQVAYWQTELSSSGHGLGPAVTIVNPSGGQSVMSTGGTSHGMEAQRSNQQYGGRARGEGKGGRGRKGGGARRGDSKTAAHPASSHILEEFRLTKNRDWTMRQIEGHVIEFCQDQNGSRFIQQRLEMGDVAEQQIVMREVLPTIRRLRNDVFGNYVVQKLLDFGTPGVKADIRETLKGEMLQLSLQMYGCRVVQKALESLDERDIPGLLAEFHHNVLSCIHDQNGNHVIQKCIEVLSTRAKKARQTGDHARADFLNHQIDFIVKDVLANTATLSCHPYGCRVLQRILEHCEDVRKTAALDEIALCHRKLLDDQYGNYVIQHVLQYGRDPDRDSILDIVLESGLLRLSRQKFASNVVEKLLKYGNTAQRSRIVDEMLKVSVVLFSFSLIIQHIDCRSHAFVLLFDYSEWTITLSPAMRT
jgi:pumilio RNA-binding family